MGNLISKHGLKPDPKKMDAICKMSAPENVTELCRLLGMANCLCRFLPDLSTILKPITDLLKSDTAWVWSTNQEYVFKQMKIMVKTFPVLAFYRPNCRCKQLWTGSSQPTTPRILVTTSRIRPKNADRYRDTTCTDRDWAALIEKGAW